MKYEGASQLIMEGVSIPAGSKTPMENPAKHLVYRPTAMQLLSILTTTMEVMPKVTCQPHLALIVYQPQFLHVLIKLQQAPNPYV